MINPTNWCRGELVYIIDKTYSGSGISLEVIGPTINYYNLNNNSLVFWAVVDGIWYYFNTPSNSIILNNWQHVAVSYEDGEVMAIINYENGVKNGKCEFYEKEGWVDDLSVNIGSSEYRNFLIEYYK